MSPDQFPLLRSTGSRRDSSIGEVIQVIADAVEAGSIRNVALTDAKHTLSSAVYDAWQKHVSDTHFHGKGRQLPSDLEEFYWTLNMHGLHDVLATSKKLGRTKVTGPAIDAMKAFVAEVLPLAQAVASLKSKVVMGRAPSTAPSKPENPDKIVRTCPCCFRAIAVIGKTMAHHGYERPGHGHQTASCAGVSFKPLERSNEGLVWLIGIYKTKIEGAIKALAELPKRTVISLYDRNAPPNQPKMVEVKIGDAKWQAAQMGVRSDLESTLEYYRGGLPVLEARLKDWVQTEAE